MNSSNNCNRMPKALTLLEMVLALTIIAVIFSTMLPQFNTIQKSWASRRGVAEAIQNGRVLTDHMNRNLTKADRIIAVSDPGDSSGFIVFEDNSGDRLRYYVGADGFVEYGPIGRPAKLAGPVSRFQLSCYSLNDMDTTITDVSSIRFIKTETTLTNAAPMGKDRHFVASAFLYTNPSGNLPPLYKEPASPFEFNVVLGAKPYLSKIDETHFICAYSGPGNDGWALVTTVDKSDWSLTRQEPFEFDVTKGTSPVLARIDDTHYLCAYSGEADDGWAVILKVDKADWTISKGKGLEFDGVFGSDCALSRIDGKHFLCSYRGEFNDGFAVVLSVDTDSDTVSAEMPFEFDTDHGAMPALAEIDEDHYLCTYTNLLSNGMMTVLTVDHDTWEISKGTTSMFDNRRGVSSALARIDKTHFLCAYSGPNQNGRMVVLNVNASTWEIKSTTPSVFDTFKGDNPNLAYIDSIGNSKRYLCVYEGAHTDGWATILTVNSDKWIVVPQEALEHDPDRGYSPTLIRIDEKDTRYLCVYQGRNNDGWAMILNTTEQVLP